MHTQGSSVYHGARPQPPRDAAVVRRHHGRRASRVVASRTVRSVALLMAVAVLAATAIPRATGFVGGEGADGGTAKPLAVGAAVHGGRRLSSDSSDSSLATELQDGNFSLSKFGVTAAVFGVLLAVLIVVRAIVSLTYCCATAAIVLVGVRRDRQP